MNQITDAEPEPRPVVLHRRGIRFQGKYPEALEAYEKAIAINPNFGPAYVGRARVNLALNPKANPLEDLDTAVENDPAFVDAYLLSGAALQDRLTMMPMAHWMTWRSPRRSLPVRLSSIMNFRVPISHWRP